MTTDLQQRPRGLRNNNPGNIRYVPAIRWQGEGTPDNEEFCTFMTINLGLRALIMILKHYHAYSHCTDIHDFISRWAPQTENDTDAYVQHVADIMHKKETDDLKLPEDLPALAYAICWHELGQPYVTMIQCQRALQLAVTC